MVEVDGADDADLPVLLAVKLFGDRLIGGGAGGVHVDHAGVGLVARGDGGRRGGGVRGKAARIVGNGGACHVKVHEVQRLGAVQHRARAVFIAVAGQGLHIVLVGERAEVVGRRLKLRVAHAVADEQEYVLGEFFRLRGQLAGVCISGILDRYGGAGGGGQQQGRAERTAGDFLDVHLVLLSLEHIFCRTFLHL